MSRSPLIWCIAGHDSAGGAGLSADLRAADALGVHGCPVIAATTAQNSLGVQAVSPTPPEVLAVQLEALSQDLPPSVIKTGLLGSVHAIEQVAAWVDRWRAQAPAGVDPHRQLGLVIDPVLGASAGGASFADDALVQAYRDLLLPRATVITPNRAEARVLLGMPHTHAGRDDALPALARRLKAMGPRSVVITGGDAADAGPHCRDWLDTPHASGWMVTPRMPTQHTHGTGCTFASGVASALALGHVEADAVVLANMLTRDALQNARVAGSGPGPVIARAGFARSPRAGGAPLPWLGLAEDPPWALSHGMRAFAPFVPPGNGLYGIVPDSDQVQHAVHAGLQCVQLRHKSHEGARAHIAAALQAVRQQDVQLFINDHWQDAREVGMAREHMSGWGLHLGQEDLLSLTADDHAQLLSARHAITLGLSSHSLWELARAAGCGASVIACGPVHPTTTKDMPWRPQGLDNLSWWVAHSPAPVVAIGGLLTPDDVQDVARSRPAAACIVRGLGNTSSAMRQAVQALRTAWQAGLALSPMPIPPLPHPVLPHSGI
ncbi:PfkB family carbohydrate kinase [Aquabacterium sp.]|uniref:PfkB family carbohydrate kinase n=1 Tax=Aquabacterium sp. TaxID=1872578 RepID=UPI003B6B938A